MTLESRSNLVPDPKITEGVARDPIVQKRGYSPTFIQEVVADIAAKARIPHFVGAIAINTLREKRLNLLPPPTPDTTSK